MMGYLHTRLSNMSRGIVLGLCLGMVAVVGLIDHVTGYELSFSVFYVIPVAIAAWYAGRHHALRVAVTSAIVWLAVDVTSGHRYSRIIIPVWNAAVRLGFFVTISHLLSNLRDFMNREKEMARTDPLTAVLNTRGFMETAEPILELARRHAHSTVLCYLDLDNFKAVNDACGHEGGDAVLKEVANILLRSMRSTDVVGRLGGDEFAVLLPETSHAGATRVAEQLLDRIRGRAQEQGWPITASIGVVVMNRPPPLREVITAADALMYQTKNAGKNGVRVQSLPS